MAFWPLGLTTEHGCGRRLTSGPKNIYSARRTSEPIGSETNSLCHCSGFGHSFPHFTHPHRLFGENLREITRLLELINEEVQRAVCDEKIRGVLSIAYAARLMELGYLTHNPMSADAADIVEQASSLGIEIINIVSLWGQSTIINLRTVGRDFRNANEEGPTLDLVEDRR